MSDPLRIALVAEGPTDRIVVDAAVKAILGDRPYILRLLQPEDSLPFDAPAPFTGKGKGWGGIYLWCQETRQRSGGRLRDDLLFLAYDLLFLAYDLLIIHLDADVASRKYSDYELTDDSDDLPCELPCPPPHATTERLRQVLLRWIGALETPPRTVLCTPSKSTEAWVVAALFPDDKVMIRKGWECHPNPESRLAVQPKAMRIKKTELAYRYWQPLLSAEWPRISAGLTEAMRFSDAILKAVEDHDKASAS